MGVLGRAEVAAPAGVQQHRGAGEVAIEEDRGGDAALRGIRQTGTPRRAGRRASPASRLGEVAAVGVAMERAVEVGARVAHHRDEVDGELGAGRIVLPRRLAGEVRRDRRRRKARVRHQPGSDRCGSGRRARGCRIRRRRAEACDPSAAQRRASPCAPPRRSRGSRARPRRPARGRGVARAALRPHLGRDRSDGRSSRKPWACRPPPLTKSISASRWARYSVTLRALFGIIRPRAIPPGSPCGYSTGDGARAARTTVDELPRRAASTSGTTRFRPGQREQADRHESWRRPRATTPTTSDAAAASRRPCPTA